MTDSEDRINLGPRNTFLSRVFGVHSSAVENSLDTAELSHFSMPNDPGFRNDMGEEHNPLLIESDQGSTSNDDSNVSGEEDTFLHQPQAIRFETVPSGLGSINSEIEEEDYDDEEDEEENREVDEDTAGEETEFSDQDLESSTSKRGQPSSSEDEENENNRLFITPKKVDPRRSNLASDETLFRTREPRVFDRILKNNPGNIFRLNNKNKDLEESFIFRKNSVNENTSNSDPSATKLKPPPIFSNIPSLISVPKNSLDSLSPKERALWKWANVENLDAFLQQVYDYYLGNGFYCIITEKIIHLATILFVVFISTYMGHCIDYSRLASSRKFEDIYIEHCYKTQVSPTAKVFLWLFYAFSVLKVLQIYFDVKALTDIKNFYNYLLSISDKDLQTISWQSVIQQLMYLKDQNAITANATEVKAKNRLSAHDVANRIMRKENFVIALYDNDILELSLPVPLLRTSVFTKTLEWNINLCVLGFAFNEKGYLKQAFLRENQQEYLNEELRKRFILAGFLNIILSPFLVTYFVLLNFFRYFNEYKTSPGSIGSRQYTPIAEWKFREYNELYHIFQKRMKLSMSLANDYVNQFPNTLLGLILSFFQFVSGSFVAILGILTIFDPDNFLNFEITKDRTVLFYMTLFGTVWAVCHGAINDEYTVFRPEETFEEVIKYTHYCPKEWEGKYHTEEVKLEFCKLYNLRIVLLLRELVSLIITPFVLWFALPRNSEKIVNFFRECTVYEEGLGYVCRYAMFENSKFDKGTKLKQRTARMFEVENEQSDSDSDSGVNKMIQSYMYFVDDYKNKENAVGKRQIPRKSGGSPIFNSTGLRKDYTWKRQFELGKNKKSSKYTHGSRAKTSQFKGEDIELGSLDGSFINHGNFTATDAANSQEDHPSGNGVMGLLNQYYRKYDVKR